MSWLLTLVLCFCAVQVVAGQSIVFSGTVYDPNGAVVVGAEIKINSDKKKSWVTSTSSEGKYFIDLPAGFYEIQISADGFVTRKYLYYEIVNSTYGKMCFDFVLSVNTSHEPCGYTGLCPGAGLTVITDHYPSEVSDKITLRTRTVVTSSKVPGF